jgi:hypothetical protein
MTRWWRSIWCAGEGEEVNGFLNCFLASDAAHSDAIDLTGFDAASTVFTEKSVSGNLVLTATDGDKVATLTFDHVDGALNFASNSAGGVVITNSPAAVGPRQRHRGSCGDQRSPRSHEISECLRNFGVTVALGQLDFIESMHVFNSRLV